MDIKLKQNLIALIKNKGILQINKENPFVLSSGLTSDYYFDARRLFSDPYLRLNINYNLSFLIKDIKQINCIAGIESGSIVWATLLANYFNLPLIYVRKNVKEYGTKKQIEGDYKVDDNIWLIEDVVTTGRTMQNAINVLKNTQLIVNLTSCIFTHLGNRTIQPRNFNSLFNIDDFR
jgi:orotate phosphoribosyltransferase